MKHLRVVCFIVGMASFLGAAGRCGYRWAKELRLWHPEIACGERTVEAGRIVAGEPLTCAFQIANRGVGTLTIRTVTPGCAACIEVLSFPHEAIAPGRCGVIHVRLITVALSGDVDKSIAVQSNDPVQPVFILRIRAHVLRTTTRIGATSESPEAT